jgi:hypothetical protein
MKIFLASLVFIATFIFSFVFWPEFAIVISCENDDGLINSGCSAKKSYDTSVWRLHGGLTWLERQNICTKSGDDCIPVFGKPERYDTNFALMILGSLSIAGLMSLAFYKKLPK